MSVDASPSTRVTLLAPVTGVMVPIEQVPDPVFAAKMVGEGVSIDPLGNELVAPCAGEVIFIHPSGHALTIRSADGLEVLTHIGLDTVKMRGEGFEQRVKVGDEVTAGQVVITFDLDLVATTAKSLLTQMVVSNSDLLSGVEPASGMVIAGADVALTVEIGGPRESADGAVASGAPAKKVTSPAIIIPNPVGLHARPASVLAKLASGYQSDITLRRGNDTANAKSMMSIMGLEVGYRDKVQISAYGPDADDAVDELTEQVTHGLGEEGAVAIDPDSVEESESAAAGVGPDEETAAAPVSTAPRSGDPDLLLGVSASPGVGVGTVLQLRHDELQLTENSSDRHGERRKLNDAIDRAQVQLRALEDKLTKDADADKAAIFAAHAELLRDPDLLDLAVSGIDKGKTAAWAWRAAFSSYADKLAKLKNEVLAGRAADVRDVGQRVLEEITGSKRDELDIPAGTILIAEDLAPSDTAQLDPTKVVGFATTSGGSTSHVAILARALDIPAVAGIEGRALDVPNGSRVILDGGKGSLRLNVSEDEVTEILARRRRQAERRAIELSHADEPAVTTDGRHIEVVANIGGLEDAQAAMTKGAEGVGLLRSEFIFLDRRTAPTEDEQAQIYTDIARALKPGQPLVIRTLDVGGDKPLPYLPIPPEENPFLGERGVRVGLFRPEVLRVQSRAILRAADAGARINVMFPMISTLDDFRQAKAIFEEEREKLGVAPLPVGIMCEVPSTAVMARQFAQEVAFFSVGTNDLTQYTLAMDRGHPKLAPQCDGLNPAVLGLIAACVQGADPAGKWVGVCGGLASDLTAVPLLIGVGVTELSASVPAIPAVKALIRTLSYAQCQELAAQALTLNSAAEVRALVPATQD